MATSSWMGEKQRFLGGCYTLVVLGRSSTDSRKVKKAYCMYNICSC